MLLDKLFNDVLNITNHCQFFGVILKYGIQPTGHKTFSKRLVNVLCPVGIIVKAVIFESNENISVKFSRTIEKSLLCRS